MNGDMKTFSDIIRDFDFSTLKTDEECEIEKEKEETNRKKQEKDAAIKSRKKSFLKIAPPRYHNVKKPINKSLIENTCSIVYGGFGTGKTWECYAVARHLYETLQIKDFIFDTEIGLINYLKAGFEENSFANRIKKAIETDLLIIDEFGKSNDTDFNKATIFDIINKRYDWQRKTILIFNAQNKEQLKPFVISAIRDRFRENIVFMGGKSRRYTEQLKQNIADNQDEW